MACRANDMKKVKRYLETMTLNEINHRESNDTTALYEATLQGHYNIVKLLLERGASSQIKNLPNRLTSYEEPKTNQIGQLFTHLFKIRYQRFGTNTTMLEWKIIPDDPIYRAYRDRYIKNLGLDRTVRDKLHNKKLLGIKKMSNTRVLLQQAKNSNDATYLLSACTAEIGFYSALCSTLAREEQGYLRYSGTRYTWQSSFYGIIAQDPLLDKHRFVGKVYRAMLFKNLDLSTYTENTTIMNITFLSTSKNRNIAEGFPNQEKEYVSPFPLYHDIMKMARQATACRRMNYDNYNNTTASGKDRLRNGEGLEDTAKKMQQQDKNGSSSLKRVATSDAPRYGSDDEYEGMNGDWQEVRYSKQKRINDNDNNIEIDTRQFQQFTRTFTNSNQNNEDIREEFKQQDFKSIFSIDDISGTINDKNRHVKIELLDMNEYNELLNGATVNLYGQRRRLIEQLRKHPEKSPPDVQLFIPSEYRNNKYDSRIIHNDEVYDQQNYYYQQVQSFSTTDQST
ncbi:unnamed protein product [Didymodactylos carnosus]|uniref:ANK_REP_REGION domain-containing protein n=1 Tax=Didymodactylos carnosus TaxID=1234261 RepID=A0A8S2NSY1_9BILA|nr:unnamed protein product [Didymodactylos carnosus]CAF4013233.1 unnamed protein product [Didymodactylos carnosus]